MVFTWDEFKLFLEIIDEYEKLKNADSSHANLDFSKLKAELTILIKQAEGHRAKSYIKKNITAVSEKIDIIINKWTNINDFDQQIMSLLEDFRITINGQNPDSIRKKRDIREIKVEESEEELETKHSKCVIL